MDHDLKRRTAAEFFGTFWLTFGGCGAADPPLLKWPALWCGFRALATAGEAAKEVAPGLPERLQDRDLAPEDADSD